MYEGFVVTNDLGKTWKSIAGDLPKGTIVWTINQGYLPDAPAGSRDPLMDALRTTFLHR